MIKLSPLAGSHFQSRPSFLPIRCMTLRKLLTSPGAVPINDLRQALQWQYEFLRSCHTNRSHTEMAVGRGPENAQNNRVSSCPASRNAASTSEHSKKDNMQCRGSHFNLNKWGMGKEMPRHQPDPGLTPASAVSGAMSAVGKPPSLSSFDSGFDGAGSSHLEAGAGREGLEGLSRLAGTRDPFRPANRQQQHPQIHEENISSVFDSEDRREEFGFGSVGNSSRASIQIIPKITVDSLNFEIQVKRSATLPKNPWLSLPVEDLENSYTVTITQNPPAQQRDLKSPNLTQHSHNADQSNRSRDQPTQTEVSTSTHSKGPQTRDWILQSQSSFEDSELSPILNVLSSTITDGRDKSNCTTEDVQTLLWDSYDFHDQKQDTCDG